MKRATDTPYGEDRTRVVSIRIKPTTLRKLRLIAAERDLTVCRMLMLEAERITGQASRSDAHAQCLA
jgi:hypothetical protein